MKKSELTFAAVLVPLDFLLVFLAALTAHSLRFGIFAEIRPAILQIPYADYLLFSAGTGAAFIAFFALAGLYAVSGPRRLRIELSRIFLAGSTGIAAVIAFIFFRHELFASRFIVLAVWFLAVVYVSIGRIAIRLLQRGLLARGIGTHRVALIGRDTREADCLAEHFARTPKLGFAVAIRLRNFDAVAAAELDKLKKADLLDEIMVTDPDLGRETMARILAFAQSRHLGFKYVADPLSTAARNVEIGTIAELPMVEIKDTRLDGWGRIFKRIFDVLASLALIIVLSPVMLVTAVAVTLDSRGPVIFKNGRVGMKGLKFNLYKFRSMIANKSVGEQFGDQQAALAYEQKLIDERGIKGGPVYKIKDDPRITRVGRFIRRYSIDELPQLINVLIGDMSLVGPRPHQPREVAKYLDEHRRVLTIKPGITGMAQISGRSDLTFDEEVKLDTFYIENWSPWIDLLILAKTPLVVLGRKGAY